MSIMSLMKEKPSTFSSSVLFYVFAVLSDILGLFLFMFGVLLLADSQINFMWVVDYLQALEEIRDEQLKESAKHIKLFLGFSSMGLGIMFFIATWIMRMVIHRNIFINKMIDELENLEWTEGDIRNMG